MKSAEEIQEILKDLVNSYEAMNDSNHPVSKEIRMWRVRYAKEKGFSDIDIAELLFTPSQNMLEVQTQRYFKMIEDK